jgi:hypothetical protein
MPLPYSLRLVGQIQRGIPDGHNKRKGDPMDRGEGILFVTTGGAISRGLSDSSGKQDERLVLVVLSTDRRISLSHFPF